jgi:hypothetical protein
MSVSKTAMSLEAFREGTLTFLLQASLCRSPGETWCSQDMLAGLLPVCVTSQPSSASSGRAMAWLLTLSES